MIPGSSLRFVEDVVEDGFDLPPRPELLEAEAPAAEPKVFVRTLSSAPGWPWEQSRAAEMEARHGAPLPLGELRYQLRRLDAWRLGAPSRFAAFYVMARDVQGRLEASADVDGRTLTVTFLSGGERGARTGQAALYAGVAGLLAVLVALSVGAALNKRNETAAALELADQRLAGKLKRLEARQQTFDQARLLERHADEAARLREAVADLAWASNAKTPEARIEALHWQPGLMVVEAKGEASPFSPMADRAIERSKKPLRKGVWLWGVTQDSPSGGTPSNARGDQ